MSLLSRYRFWIFGTSVLLLAGLGSVQAQPVVLPIPTSAGDQAGYDVAISGGYVLVGAPFDDERGTDAGTAYVFRRTGAGWTLEAKLTAADAAPGDRFGWSVALDGETAVIGAPYRDQPIRRIGGAYVFERNARRGWQQTAALKIPADDVRLDAWFGRDVAKEGRQILVIGPQPYLFARAGDRAGGWKLETTLPFATNDVPGAVWLDDDTMLVAAWKDPHIHLFAREPSGLAGGRAAVVTPAEALNGPRALDAIRRHGGRILAGASRADGRSPQAGAVLLFEPDPARTDAWHQQARLIAPDGAPGDHFGIALAAREDVVVVGASGVDGSRADAGAVYVYQHTEEAREDWTLVTRITPPSGVAGFGRALALQANTLVVGAPTAARGSEATGGVYIYDLTRLPPAETLAFEQVAGQKRGLARSHLYAIVQDRVGWLWFGTNGGLFRYDGYDTEAYRHDARDSTSIPSDVVVALLEDRRGTLWVGTQNGLARFEPACDCFRRYPLYRSPGTASQDVVSLFEDRDGILWTGTHGRLFRYDAGADRFEEFAPFTGPPDDLDETYISAIQQDIDGRLWVLAKHLRRISHSLYRLDIETGAVSRFAVPAAWGQIGPLLIDRQGRFWVNAAEPLRFSDDGERLMPPASPVADVPWTIYEDRQGTIWHGTPSGLYRLAPEADEATHHRLVEEVNDSGANFVTRVYEDRSGTLLLGTLGQGFYRARRAWTGDPNPSLPGRPLVLTGIAVTSPEGTREVAPHTLDALRLTHRDYNVSMQYAALNYTPPGTNRYRYRLEGYDRDWVEAGVRREAFYTNLPPGRYIFRVEAYDTDRTVVAAPLALPLEVVPPWWGTTWFRLLALMVVTGVLTLGWRHQRARRRERERLRQLDAERQQSEEEARRLAELDAAKSRFFANISHEFRTPLTLILGAADRLSEDEAEPVRRPARQLLVLIDQLLDLSKLEAGKLRLDPQPGHLATVLRRLVHRFMPLAEHYRIALSFRTAGEENPTAFDADKVSTIVSNLLSNALKFTPERGKVLVALSQHDEGNRVVAEIVVKDTGPGIPKEALPRIFDRFEQVNGTGGQGTGIGLSLAKELAELHGGTILVESELDFGSAFIVRLPLERVASIPAPPVAARVPVVPDASAAETPGPPPASPNGLPTVLLVEDNAEVRALVRGYLDADYHVVEAADGEDGLTRARAHPPDLVLSDVMMPKLDGVALCRALKADDALRTVPVVLLTAKASDESAVEGLAAGADAYLTKPFHAGVLRATLQNLLAARGQMRAQFSKELIVQPNGVVVASEEQVFLESILFAVEDRLGDSTFGVEALAEAVSLSRRQLERRLRDATGQTPAELIRQMRLERASQLLKARSGSVSEIAYAVGFKSANYFSTAFREAFGHSPSEHFDAAS